MFMSKLCSWWLSFIFLWNHSISMHWVNMGDRCCSSQYLLWPCLLKSFTCHWFWHCFYLQIHVQSLFFHLCLQSSPLFYKTYFLYLVWSNNHLPTLLLQCLKMTGGRVVLIESCVFASDPLFWCNPK